MFQAVRPELKLISYGKRKLFCRQDCNRGFSRQNCSEVTADLWNDFDFSLCTTLSVCYIVTTSEKRKKSKMEVSAD